MEPVRLSGEEFAGVLHSGEAYEQVADSGSRVVLVDGDRVPDVLDASSMQHLATLPAVVVGAVADQARRKPAWADVVVGADRVLLESIVSTVQAVPLAATTLAVLLAHRRPPFDPRGPGGRVDRLRAPPGRAGVRGMAAPAPASSAPAGARTRGPGLPA